MYWERALLVREQTNTTLLVKLVPVPLSSLTSSSALIFLNWCRSYRFLITPSREYEHFYPMSSFSTSSVTCHLKIGLMQVSPGRSSPVHHQNPVPDPESSCMFWVSTTSPTSSPCCSLITSFSRTLMLAYKKNGPILTYLKTDQTSLWTMFYLSHQHDSSKTCIKTLFFAGTQ